MEITKVKIQTISDRDEFRAYADITFENCFCVIGLRLFVGPNGYELFMPTKKMPRGERLPLAYPVTDEMRNTIEAAVLAEYERVTRAHVRTPTNDVQAQGETRQEIEERMDALARQYLDIHDAEIIRQMNELCRLLDELKETA